MISLSATGFALGTDFSCTQSYCEARGLGAAAAYRALQTGANALASRLGLRSSNQIAVDGRIGRNTVELIQLLAISVPITAQSSLSTYWDTSKEEISRDAAALAAEIGLLLQSNVAPGGTPPGTPPSIPSGGKPNTVLVAQVFPSAGGLQPPQAGMTVTAPVGPIFIPQVPTKYIIGGVAVAIGAITTGLAVSRMRKRRRAS